MRKQNEHNSFPGIGGSSLLIIFAVLCLTVFCLLGLSTVKANQRLSDVSIKAISDYYAADCKAEEILTLLRHGETPEGVSVQDGICRYTCTISETQTLVDEYDRNTNEILRWQAVSTAQWEADEHLELWDGSSQ